MAVAKEVVNAQLKALGPVDLWGTKKEVAYLPEVLMEGETIFGLCSGVTDGNRWLCVITDIRILMLNKGLLFGLKQLDLPLKQIKSVSHKQGMISSSLLINTSGQIKKLEDLAKADAAKMAALLADLLHKKEASAEAPIVPVPPATAEDHDVVSRLERLAALKEKGILTDEEFLQQKAKILEG